MPSSKTKWFETPTSGFGYASRFYLKVFQSLKQEESLALDTSLPPMKTSWFLDEAKYNQWMSLVDYDESLAPQAFTFSAPAGVWALMQVLEEIGISFSRIMHMSSRLLMIHKDGFNKNQHHSTYVHYLGARPHSKRAVLIRFQSIVKDVTGRDIMNLEDELYVAGLDEEFVKSLSMESEASVRRSSKSKLANNPHADKITLSIPRNMGQKYGKLSGDLNPLHISSIGARLFGHKKSFVQGLCTLNIIVAQLGRHWKGSVRSMEIHFLRPVPQPAKLVLHCTLDQFELIDEAGTLLVTGQYLVG
jgi:hypothetical protein